MIAARGVPRRRQRAGTALAVVVLVLEVAGVGAGPVGTVRPALALGAPSLAAGQERTCGVQSDGTLACWGDNALGVASPPSGTFTQASSGYAFGCGVRTDRTIACWGDNSLGQLDVPAGSYTAVSAGGDHACALTVAGTVACWGHNPKGEATPPPGVFTAVSAGAHHTCGIQVGGSVVCWGYDTSGDTTPPSGVFSAVSAGDNSTCGINVDGTVACWGQTALGQVTPPPGTFRTISAGKASKGLAAFTCGVRTDGTLACWGNNADGRASPPAGAFSAVSAGGAQACGVRTDGTVACWGSNAYGDANPRITTPVPPGGTLGASYTSSLATTFESPAATFRVTAGSLPPGLALSDTGLLSGTPTAVGTFPGITVSATNGLAPPATQTFSLTIAPDATLTTVIATPQPSVVGQAVTYTATVAAAHPAAGRPGGTVAFSADGSPGPLAGCAAQPLDPSGRATCPQTWTAAGHHAISAAYSGSDSFQASQGTLADGQTVDAAATDVTVTAGPDHATAARDVTLRATVAARPPGAGTPTGTVRFVIDGADDPGGPVGLSAGTATTTVRLPAGGHTVTAAYSGTADYLAATSAPVTVPVDRTPTAVSIAVPDRVEAGRPAALTVTVAPADGGPGVPTGAVQVTVDGAAVADPAPLVDGRATVRRRLPAGHHTIGALYPGDPTFGPATAPGTDLTAENTSGYWLAGVDGAVFPFGDAVGHGDARGRLSGARAVDLEPTPSGGGYWVADDRGGVHPFGDAAALGSAAPGALGSGESVVSLAPTDTGAGYWLFTSRGRVLTFGDAPAYGDMAGRTLNSPVVRGVLTPTGRGYYLLAADGGVFTFGDATFAGSLAGQRLNAPLVSLAPDADGRGYWLVTADGGVFAFDAAFRGSMSGTRLNQPITAAIPYGDGYLLVGGDGGVFVFSDLAFRGSLGDHPPADTIITVAWD